MIRSERFEVPYFLRYIHILDAPHPVVLIGETERVKDGNRPYQKLVWGYTHDGKLKAFRRVPSGMEEVRDAPHQPCYQEAKRWFSARKFAFIAGGMMWQNAPEKYREQLLNLED